MVTHVLDTSALLAHYFGEPGADQVQEIWEDKAHRPAICALSLPEFRGRLRHEIEDSAEVERAIDLYTGRLVVLLPVDRTVAEEADKLRESIDTRLPLVDAMIAATARKAGVPLVHRDPHISAIPTALVAQISLFPKPCP